MISIPVLGGHELIQREFPGRGEDALAALGEAGILGDAKDPGLDLLWLAQLIRTFEHLEQCLLCHFLGVFPLPAHQPTVVEDPGAEIVDKTVEGLRFSGNQSSRKFDFVLSLQRRLPAFDCSWRL